MIMKIIMNIFILKVSNRLVGEKTRNYESKILPRKQTSWRIYRVTKMPFSILKIC